MTIDGEWKVFDTLKKWDILADDKVLYHYNKLDSLSKKLVMTKFLFEWHTRYTKLFNENDNIDYLTSSLNSNLWKYDKNFRLIDNKKVVTENIIVDVWDIESMREARTSLTMDKTLIGEDIRKTLVDNPELFAEIQKVKWDWLRNKIDVLVKDMIANCS